MQVRGGPLPVKGLASDFTQISFCRTVNRFSARTILRYNSSTLNSHSKFQGTI